MKGFFFSNDLYAFMVMDFSYWEQRSPSPTSQSTTKDLKEEKTRKYLNLRQATTKGYRRLKRGFTISFGFF